MIKTNKITYILLASLVLNALLSFGMFSQWRSRTLLFSRSYELFAHDIRAGAYDLNYYLETGDFEDLTRAYNNLQEAFRRTDIFYKYYQTDHGYKVSSSLQNLLRPEILSENIEDKDYLRKYKDILMQIYPVLIPEDVYSTNPRHYRKLTADLLILLETVVIE